MATAAGDEPAPSPLPVASDSSFLASNAPAWVPDRPVPAEEGWETGVRMPLRIATLPLSILGYAARSTTRYLEEHQLHTRVSSGVSTLAHPPLGLSLKPAHMGPGVGFSAAADWSPSLWGSLFTADLAGSTKKYTRTLLAVHRGPATFNYEYGWRPREPYFGVGIGSSDDDNSSYAWRQQRYRLTLGYRRRQTDKIRPYVSTWVGPREVTIRHGRLAPSFEDVFPGQANLLNLRQEHFVYGVQSGLDTRAGKPHWSRGFQAEFRGERFDKPIKALTIRSGNTSSPQFTRLTFSGQAGVSFWTDPRTLRLAFRAVSASPLRDAAPLLPPDFATLGAGDGLASLDLGRFRDRDLLYGSLMYIFPVSSHFEFEIHSETGSVFQRMRDAKRTNFRHSHGISLRPRTDSMVIGVIGADWSPGEFVIRYELGKGE